MNSTGQHYLNDQPVTIVGRADQRGQVWVELPTGSLLRVHRSGLSTERASDKPTRNVTLRVEDNRAFAPAIR